MRTCNMVTAILWVTAALLSWAAGERAQYRLPADLGLSPVPLPPKTKESRVFFGSPACTYQGKTGTCYGTVECLALAGTFGNFCSGLSGLCCLFHRSCGMRTSQKSAYFQNVNYPQSGRVEKNCEMRVVKRSDEFCALRVIMKEADLPKPSRAGFCNDASYVVTGTRSSAIAPKCGDLTGQTYTYDMRYTDELQLSINTTTMRNGLQWNMEIHQVPCSEYNSQLAGGDGAEAGSGSEGGTVPIEPDGSTGTQGPIGPDGSTGTQGPTAPLKPPPVKPPAPPAPPPTKPTSPPSNIKCGERGPPFTTSRTRDYARIWEPTGRRNYPRPGETFQRPSSTYRGGRPNRRTSNRRRPNRKSSSNRSTTNKRQETDSKQTSAVQQETTVVPKPRFTGVIKSTEWGVPDLTDTLFHEYMGQRFRPPTRITFGRLAGIREIPWQVAMVVDGKFHCGGVLIGEQWILTAAHCVVRYKDTPHKLELTLGDWDLKTDKDGKSLNVTAQRVTVHPSYSRATLQNDVAVIRLTSKVTYTERIKPACLPTTDMELAGKECTISGWGRNEAKLLQEQLQVLEAKVVSNVLCDERWNTQGAPKGFIVDSMKCMDATSGDSCNGDSGGPSVLEHPPGSGRYVLVGIVSFGSGSCVEPQLPGVYTRVSYFRQWISDNMV